MNFIMYVLPLQEVPELSTREVLIIHHTDCGAQAAMRHHDYLVARMQQLMGQWNVLGWVIQVRRWACQRESSGIVCRPGRSTHVGKSYLMIINSTGCAVQRFEFSVELLTA